MTDNPPDPHIDDLAPIIEDDSGPDDRKLTMRERANAPSDTVGTGSYAAISCSIMAVLLTLVLIAGLLISRWLF